MCISALKTCSLGVTFLTFVSTFSYFFTPAAVHGDNSIPTSGTLLGLAVPIESDYEEYYCTAINQDGRVTGIYLTYPSPDLDRHITNIFRGFRDFTVQLFPAWEELYPFDANAGYASDIGPNGELVGAWSQIDTDTFRVTESGNFLIDADGNAHELPLPDGYHSAVAKVIANHTSSVQLIGGSACGFQGCHAVVWANGSPLVVHSSSSKSSVVSISENGAYLGIVYEGAVGEYHATQGRIAGFLMDFSGEIISFSVPLHFTPLTSHASNTTAAQALVNNTGDLLYHVNQEPDSTQVFLKTQAGSLYEIGDLGGGSTTATVLTNERSVLGSSVNGDNEKRAFLWEPRDGDIHDLNSLVYSLGFDFQSVTDMNESGLIIANHTTDSAATSCYVLFPPVTFLPPLTVPAYGNQWLNVPTNTSGGTAGGGCGCNEASLGGKDDSMQVQSDRASPGWITR